MKLFQYWDSPTPPEEIFGWIEGFKTMNPDFEHALFDHAHAQSFIAEHHGPRALAAFRSCAVPAMQADYLRLCLLDTYGGLYVDADNQCKAPLSGLIERAPSSLMFTWFNLMNNGFMMFRRPGDPFIKACLELATDRIERRIEKVVFMITGPGIVNAVRALLQPDAIPRMASDFDNPTCRDWGFHDLIDQARRVVPVTPELTQAFEDLTLMNAMVADPWIGGAQPAYKDEAQHWLRWTGSIYQ